MLLPSRRLLRLPLAPGAALAAALAAGCGTVQRLPGPLGLPADADPLPAASSEGLGPQAVVVRHADAVAIRRAGELGSQQLTHYRKRVRLAAGGWITTRAEGKAEVYWPGDASSLLLIGAGAVELGDPERAEPFVTIHDVTSARLSLTPEDVVRFAGGAELRGDPTVPSGPFLVERKSAERIRITNRSKRAARLTYGGEVLELAAGYERELPVLGDGQGHGESPERLDAAGIELQVQGPLRRLEGASGPVFEAGGAAEISGLGVRVRLGAGERVAFGGLGGGRLALAGSGEGGP